MSTVPPQDWTPDAIAALANKTTKSGAVGKPASTVKKSSREPKAGDTGPAPKAAAQKVERKVVPSRPASKAEDDPVARKRRLLVLGGVGVLIVMAVLTVVFFSMRGKPASGATGTPTTIGTEDPLAVFVTPDESAPTVTPTRNPGGGGFMDGIIQLFGTYTPTPTDAPTSTPTPTRTPTPTATPLIVPTLSIVDAARWALGLPFETPTPMDQPTVVPPPTETPVLLLEPPTPTLTPIPTLVVTALPGLDSRYELRGLQVEYMEHPVYGCNWSSIAGEVIKADGSPMFYYNLHLYILGADFGRNAISGHKPDYGPAGFEFYFGEIPQDVPNKYFIQLQDQNGKPVSPRYGIPLFAECGKNVAKVTFVEIK